MHTIPVRFLFEIEMLVYHKMQKGQAISLYGLLAITLLRLQIILKGYKFTGLTVFVCTSQGIGLHDKVLHA